MPIIIRPTTKMDLLEFSNKSHLEIVVKELDEPIRTWIAAGTNVFVIDGFSCSTVNGIGSTPDEALFYYAKNISGKRLRVNGRDFDAPFLTYESHSTHP